MRDLSLVRCKGITVFVADEPIEICDDFWKNEQGLFETLEEAVNDALNRLKNEKKNNGHEG